MSNKRRQRQMARDHRDQGKFFKTVGIIVLVLLALLFIFYMNS